VVLYGCENWSLTLRVKHRLGVFENRVLRRIFVPKIGEIIGGAHTDEIASLSHKSHFILFFQNYESLLKLGQRTKSKRTVTRTKLDIQISERIEMQVSVGSWFAAISMARS
jgi:hypothetical protein